MNLFVSVFATLALLGVALALFSFAFGRRIEAALPATGQWLEVGGERIHYRALGRGPALVLVHGLGGQMRHFDYLPLQELAARHRVVLVDRPGSGHSQRGAAAQAGITAQARLLAGFIRAMAFPQPPLLVGHSLGGAVALGVALHDPDCIAGLALIAPLTHVEGAVPPPFRMLAIRSPWVRRLFAQTLATPLALAGSSSMLAAQFGPDRAPSDFAHKGGGLLGVRPAGFFSASTDLCAALPDLQAQQERYGELALPVHILHGRDDRILDWQVQSAGLQQKVAHSTLQLVPGGHMLPVSAPERTAAWLKGAADAAWDPAQ